MTTPEPDDGSVLRAGRQACWQAKDLYFNCHHAGDSVGSAQRCQAARQAFTEACPASWVKHFEDLRAKQRLPLQTLHDNINRTAPEAKGRLAGQTEQS